MIINRSREVVFEFSVCIRRGGKLFFFFLFFMAISRRPLLAVYCNLNYRLIGCNEISHKNISGKRAAIGLSVFGSRIQAKDHGLGTVQRTAYPT